MGNYKPNSKGVIARDTLIPPRAKFGLFDVFVLVSVLALTALFAFMTFVTDSPVVYVLIFLGVSFLVGYPVILYAILPAILKRKKAPKYYLELDTVSSVVMTTELRRNYSNRYKRYITYHVYTIAFKSRRIFTRKYIETASPYDQFPTMKNKENIPYHMATVRELAEGDVCYLLQREGEDKIFEIFDSKYYTPSAIDFEQFGDRYYLSEVNTNE